MLVLCLVQPKLESLVQSFVGIARVVSGGISTTRVVGPESGLVESVVNISRCSSVGRAVVL